jgi:Mg2+-importing ATPase
MAASSNFGNIFSVLVASMWLPFLPMLPVMLLVQNLLYDLSQIMIPYDQVDDEYLEKPRRWCAEDVRRFIFCIGPISSIFDILTFCILWFVLGANAPDKQALFQSGWFVEGLLSQTLIIHLIRTAKVPFFQSVAAFPLSVSTLVVMALALIVPFSSFGTAIGMAPLPWNYFPWLGAILIGYCVLAQLVKVWYIRHFGMWL